jgi:hypothetical protein
MYMEQSNYILNTDLSGLIDHNEVKFENHTELIEYFNKFENFDQIIKHVNQKILRYKFVFNVFILAERHKETYSKASKGEERDLEDIFKDLGEEANVFSYIVPAFSAAPNLKSCIECNGLGA